MRISRPCYDKYWRCPGWAGGGWRFARKDLCDNGYLDIDWNKPGWRWWWHRCPSCRVWVMPYMWRYLSPPYWVHRPLHAVRNGLYRLWNQPRVVLHDPVWELCVLPVSRDRFRTGYRCVHPLENGNDLCCGEVFELEDAVGRHSCVATRWDLKRLNKKGTET